MKGEEKERELERFTEIWIKRELELQLERERERERERVRDVYGERERVRGLEESSHGRKLKQCLCTCDCSIVAQFQTIQIQTRQIPNKR
jgi:hypothetical protein